MFGINGSEFVLLLLVAVIVVGPERLPRYAEQLGAWVRTLRGFLRNAKERVDEELGEQAGDVDWTALDPRRYDPRRIVREALLDDPPPRADPGVRSYTSRARTVGAAGADGAPAATAAAAAAAAAPGADAGTPVAPVGAPFDDEAT
ncbi:twin-arginine translocase TatA/TatE family subunit [Pengzhenrongella phosphoraccumulans]|uniref:twin-arginine translocase TatA/TatE family subunit n=1 Tax=Pengzhenrongella phosphoraccumulans TaxID=3114394 RepID=UPI00388E1CF3